MKSLPTSEEQNRDLGFGSVVSRESHQRLLNRDGSFNVHRTGYGLWSSLSAFQALITISWAHFGFVVLGSYLVLNSVFAFAYLLCGREALHATVSDGLGSGFLRAFFFSVETFATIGYGGVTPTGLAANIVVTIESLVGLLSLALATGILFARFSRPTAKIMFSRNAVIAPYRENIAFEFRIANERKNQIIELEAKVLFSRFEPSDGSSVRRYYNLALERNKVAFFPLSWTIVHPVDPTSPLYGLTDQDLRETQAEFLILLTGIDETFSQTVHARSSYRAEEVIWNARFSDVFERGTRDEELHIDIQRLHNIERLL
jgi:inward rectifier potassium channel